MLSFENWRGGANGIRGGGIAPPAPPLATALAFSSFEAQIFGPRAYQVWKTLVYTIVYNVLYFT